METFIVLLGPPGAGKGTQAKEISENLGFAHISSGDLFRENLKSQTDLGSLAQSYIQRGELVPDDVTIGMIRERLGRPDTSKGVVLDGFPRTPAQADAFMVMLTERGTRVKIVPYIHVPDEVLIERLSGRWTCRQAGHVFHEKYNPPRQTGICDIDGSELYQREDDKPETVKQRIRVYMEQTSPLIGYYRERGLLEEVDGTKPIEEVTKQLMDLVNKR